MDTNEKNLEKSEEEKQKEATSVEHVENFEGKYIMRLDEI